MSDSDKLKELVEDCEEALDKWVKSRYLDEWITFYCMKNRDLNEE